MGEKIEIRQPKAPKPVNTFLIRLSKRFRLYKFIALGALVLYFLVAFMFFRDSITYENLQYLMRDFSTARSNETFSTVYFDASSITHVRFFRGDLLVIGPKNLSVYSVGGKQSLSRSLSYSTPRVCSSDKYFLIYDAEGDSYSVYNSYTILFSETMPGPVYDACMSDSGCYAVLTSTREYPYVVFVYDKNFRCVGEYYRNRTVADLALSEDGRYLYLLTYSVQNGTFHTELSRSLVGKEEEPLTASVSGDYPLTLFPLNDGACLLATDSGVYHFAGDGTVTKLTDLGSEKLERYALGNKYSALMTQSDAMGLRRVVLFDTSGNVLYNSKIKYKVLDMKLNGSYIYLLTDASVIRINGVDGTQDIASCPSGAQSLLISQTAGSGSMGRAVVCYHSSAVTIRAFEPMTDSGTAAQAK